MSKKYYNIRMEKYYQPIPKEELCKPLPGDSEVEAFCLFGLIVCGGILLWKLFAPLF